MCVAASIGSADAALTEDSFLLRNTGDLVELCSAEQPDPMYTAASNFCHGFAVGVFRVLQEENRASRSNPLFCLPNPAPTRNQAIAGLMQWAKANPSQMAKPAADSIAAFLSHQYKCARGR